MSNALNLGNIVLPGDGYPSLFGFQIPVVDGLEGAFLLGDGLTMAVKNYAPGKQDGSIIGSPVNSSGYLSFDDGIYIDTGIAETNDLTVVVAAKVDTASSTNVATIGNFASTGSGGFVLYEDATSIAGRAVRSGSLSLVGSPVTPGNFALSALRMAASAVDKVVNLTTGVSSAGADTAARTLSSAPIRVGSVPYAAFSGKSDVALAVIYSRAVTDAELSLIATWARNYCAAKGITV